jgi:hypothetical protein
MENAISVGGRVGWTTRKSGFGSQSECRPASTLGLRPAQRGWKLTSLCVHATLTAVTFKKIYVPPTECICVGGSQKRLLFPYAREEGVARGATFIIIGEKQTLPL